MNESRKKALLTASEQIHLALIALNDALWLPWDDLEEGDEHTVLHNVVDIRHEIEGQNFRLHGLRQKLERTPDPNASKVRGAR